MKKTRNLTLLKLTIVLIVILLGIMCGRKTVKAATPIKVSFTSPKCNVGQSVTVGMTINPESTGVQNFDLAYSSDYLKMTGWSGGYSNGSNAVVSFNAYTIHIAIDYSNTGSSVVTYYFTFQALKAGTGSIWITSIEDVSDPTGQSPYEVSKEKGAQWGPASITISQPPTAPSDHCPGQLEQEL